MGSPWQLHHPYTFGLFAKPVVAPRTGTRLSTHFVTGVLARLAVLLSQKKGNFSGNIHCLWRRQLTRPRSSLRSAVIDPLITPVFIRRCHPGLRPIDPKHLKRIKNPTKVTPPSKFLFKLDKNQPMTMVATCNFRGGQG